MVWAGMMPGNQNIATVRSGQPVLTALKESRPRLRDDVRPSSNRRLLCCIDGVIDRTVDGFSLECKRGEHNGQRPRGNVAEIHPDHIEGRLARSPGAVPIVVAEPTF